MDFVHVLLSETAPDYFFNPRKNLNCKGENQPIFILSSYYVQNI